MNLNKSYEFFQPERLPARIHIIGCGAVGSTIAENLARFGVTKMTLYDFDTVEPHNIANQMFRQKDIGKLKVDALKDIITEINPDAEKDLKLVSEGYKGQKLSGYVFLAVDSIDLRREIATKNKNNAYIKGMFDFRIGLTDGQHYAADWSDAKMVEAFLATMDFTHEEAKANAPVSACNLELSVCPSVRSICAAGVANFVNFAKGGHDAIKKVILADAFQFGVCAM